ncbi:carboxymuconolactone decarboxylase family protein [Dactylosporangium fulvum]|uniref:Carboxymuconolactone decarboxylase family protein n=1 Tax=Dactylosporangium fulvum TaxID=53359 RepID=A0ABY5W386_9ACTN|nr:carboxymuconolactone decarboxylase family protein [Dactylosporangium fulvum]UWP84415.1 carboxymuconolactone decarboxylase family protein [Dactylosporangium fulvum]
MTQHLNTPRININEVSPAAYQAVSGLEKYIRANVDGDLLHLIKLRASILNGCSFCVDMHSREGLADGADSRKLFAVAAWREGPFFDERERAALELTDTVTRLGEHGVPDEVWDGAVKHFGEAGVLNLLMAIATINVWNRLVVSTRMQPPTV